MGAGEFIVTRIIAPSVVFVAERIYGWRTEGEAPDAAKFLLITEPHTSNMDVVVMLYWACKIRRRIRFITKKEAASWFLVGRFLKWAGALFIDRAAPLAALKTIIREARKSESFVLLIAPTGTRSYTEGWHPGFHYIAQKTGLPMLPAGPDYERKLAVVGELIHPGDIEADIEKMRPFFEPLAARHPENNSPIRLLSEDQQKNVPAI